MSGPRDQEGSAWGWETRLGMVWGWESGHLDFMPWTRYVVTRGSSGVGQSRDLAPFSDSLNLSFLIWEMGSENLPSSKPFPQNLVYPQNKHARTRTQPLPPRPNLFTS